MKGVNGTPRGAHPPEQVQEFVGQPTPSDRRRRPVFSPREVRFFIYLPIVVGITLLVGFASISAYDSCVTIECTVVVDVHSMRPYSDQTDRLDMWIDLEGWFGYRAGSSSPSVTVSGNASSTFPLKRIGSYTLTVMFQDDPSGVHRVLDFELTPDDDGGTRHIQVTL